MSPFKKTISIFGAIILTLIFVGVYFGFVPFLSSVAETNVPRDLGIMIAHEPINLPITESEIVNLKSGSLSSGNLQTKEITSNEINTIKTRVSDKKLLSKTSVSVDTSLTNEELLFLLQKWNTEQSPIEKGFQLRINSDDTVELSGILNKSRFSSLLSLVNVEGLSFYMNLLSFAPDQVPFYVKGKVGVENNKVNLTPGEFEIGRMPLPVGEGIVLFLEKWIENKISGLKIETLNFSRGKMNVKGVFPSELLF